MRGLITWTPEDVVRVLGSSHDDANKVLAFLQSQGYVTSSENGRWATTSSGHIDSGSRLPRFQLQNVDGALSVLFDRIAAANKDENAEFRITEAVAFGDFLLDQTNCQAADVGIELEKRSEHGKAGEFLKRLGQKNSFLCVRPFEPWMVKRLHRRLL
jgi:hypothetical protein